MEHAILLLQCPDQKGIVARVSEFIFRHDGNIINSDQYTTDPEGGRFFIRIEFYFDLLKTSRKSLQENLSAISDALSGVAELHFDDRPLRMGVLVSKQDHCLYDLLYLRRSGELSVEIPLVISNHEDCRALVESHGIPFHYLAVTKDTKASQEKRMVQLLEKTTDFLVLARYMQILSENFITAYGKDVINIHHSFLPGFKGANPYRQAYDRGVKLIGATAHYVTPQLDEGPIIEQVVDRVYYKDTVEELKRKGKNLEKLALANAIQAHVERRIIRMNPKTIVFQ